MKKKSQTSKTDKLINEKKIQEQSENIDLLKQTPIQPETSHSAEIEELRSKILQVEEERQKIFKEKEDTYSMYLKVVREKQEMYQIMKDSAEKYAKKSMQDIIFIVKQLDYVIKNAELSEQSLNEVQNLQKNTVKRLHDSYGVTIYKPEVGAKFNPNTEKAISVEKTPEKEKDETIATVLANAFIKDGQTISEALVIVYQLEEQLN
jgi:molecular chaperone GrpE (heat shock protein)